MKSRTTWKRNWSSQSYACDWKVFRGFHAVFSWLWEREDLDKGRNKGEFKINIHNFSAHKDFCLSFILRAFQISHGVPLNKMEMRRLLIGNFTSSATICLGRFHGLAAGWRRHDLPRTSGFLPSILCGCCEGHHEDTNGRLIKSSGAQS